ncbi:extensin [Hyphomicrobium nitrativorans NL23]|uniref:Extensin n=1 Tax=Hyphomicrobium nitrativorans NL23 TaxID=1029756 RepID=V5SDH5_9HYPH|nr:extensin family protein [Hyphomicrobium nitrativorans]AHB48542.1 extensin [Hyphomicrobium nitrativorans NL23]
MSPKPAPIRRLRPLIAIFGACGLPFAAMANDGSFAGSVTSAFETIVIDATKAAAQAKAAAQNAMGSGKKKRKSRSNQEKAAEDPIVSEIELPVRKPRPVYGKAPEQPAAPPPAAAPTEKAAAPAPAKPAGKSAIAADPKAEPAPKAAEPAKKPNPNEWPAEDVELARARCTQLLKGLDVVTVPEPPMRKGDCGAHAPVRLISIGKSPEVSVSPPAVVSCDMVVALHKWITEDIQPLAKRHLGAEVIKMESMSDYSCRMAYGRVGNKLSEHGKANALDIRGFMTRKGKTAEVLAGWGPNRRDIAREIVATKLAAEKAAAAKAAAEKSAAEAAAQAEAVAAGKPIPRATLVEGLPKETDKTNPLAKQAALHLGGPEADPGAGKNAKNKKSADKKRRKQRRGELDPAIQAALPAERAPARDNTARFLYAAHDSACKIFGTTLGPEANEAHRNHFHVDMAPRKFKKICR